MCILQPFYNHSQSSLLLCMNNIGKLKIDFFILILTTVN